MARLPHPGSGITSRLLLMAGIAVLALAGSALAQQPMPVAGPENASKGVEQLATSVEANAPSAVNAGSPSTVQSDVNSNYTAQPLAEPIPGRPAPKPSSSFAPARVQGPLPSTNRTVNYNRPLDATRNNPQLISPSTSHKDFTYAARPSAHQDFTVPGASRPAPAHAAPASSSSPSVSPFRKASPPPIHTAHKAKKKPPVTGGTFGASNSTALGSNPANTRHKPSGRRTTSGTVTQKPLQ
jgi:hypothetical protein